MSKSAPTTRWIGSPSQCSGAGVNGIHCDVAEKIGLVWDADVTVETYAANGEVMDLGGWFFTIRKVSFL